MTYPDALHLAEDTVIETEEPIALYEHTGTPKVRAQGRFITRPIDAPPPKFGWTKRLTLHPDGELVPEDDYAAYLDQQATQDLAARLALTIPAGVRRTS